MQTQKKHEGIHIPRAKNYIPRFLGTCYLTRILTSAQCIFPVMCVLSCFSHVCLFVVLWTVAHQAPLCMGFSRQECWSGLHALLQGIFLNLLTSRKISLVFRQKNIFVSKYPMYLASEVIC